MKNRIIKLSALILLVLTLANCGNKGDLYIPDKQEKKTQASNQGS